MKMISVTRLALTVVLSIATITAIPVWNYGSPRAAVSGLGETIALLPVSDAIAVVDVARIMNELLPQLRSISPDTANSLEKNVAEVIAKTGIDPMKIRSAVIGITMSGQNATGAALVEGVNFDSARVLALLNEKKQEAKVIDYKGKQLFVVPSKEATKAGEKVGVGIESDLAFTQMGSDRVAIGTLSGVKAVVDGGAGTSNSALGSLLDQAGNGLIRFAANIPESTKNGLSAQGDLFQQFATIKTVFGSFDLTADLSAVLDTRMRTATGDDASKLQTSLAGLVGLGKMFLGGNNDPTMEAIGSVLDLIRIGVQGNDVSLTLTVPRTVFDKIAESSKKKAEKVAK